MAAWSNFFFAEVGASAALVGLIFVAVSINLSKISASPRLVSRGFEALSILLVVLIACSLMLVPDQSNTVIGLELLVIGVIMWVRLTWHNIKDVRQVEPKYRRFAQINFAFDQVTMLPYIAAALSVLTWGTNGLYWLVAATILSFCKALSDAWVLLIEINR